MNIKIPTLGDYVLAAYINGDPRYYWAVGFYTGMTETRFIVVDNKGTPFRQDGFEKIKKISKKHGDWLLNHRLCLRHSGKSLWHYTRLSHKKLLVLHDWFIKVGLLYD